ncbi:MAG: 3'(2'),5'-bisphosphate nucleotidase CysQ [Alphaproteobacteria bacterium]|nr:3'(2'),5'-bisphosphate nucleotidase CysQ [Alphaproteobacteria bacterium]
MKESVLESQSHDRDSIVEIFADIALEAGVAIMAIYGTNGHARQKPDGSPVCDADEVAEAIILKRLAEYLPGLPVLAEEGAARGEGKAPQKSFLLVDPVDGTREFLSRSGEFTINIGLVIDAVPSAGVIFAPALGLLWTGGRSATRCEIGPGMPLPKVEDRAIIHARPSPKQGLTALVSRSHLEPATEAFIAKLPVIEKREAGSSLKFCTIAEGLADVYPRFGPTMEWDTAAGHAVLRAAGGIVCDEWGHPLLYGKTDIGFKNGPFIAWGDPQAACRYRDG